MRNDKLELLIVFDQNNQSTHICPFRPGNQPFVAMEVIGGVLAIGGPKGN